jgi:cysteine sulfinate desulfinase/cysteine desulfurase-like protein
MGWRGPAAREAVRFTLGPATTEAEIDLARDVVVAAAASLAGLDAMGD